MSKIDLFLQSYCYRHHYLHRPDYDVFTFLDRAAADGFTGVSINMNGPNYRQLSGTSPEHIRRVRDRLEANKLRCDIETSGTDDAHLTTILKVCETMGVEQARTYMRHAGTPEAFGAERAAAGILLSLFHDIGYLREKDEEARNGAEFTRNHVSRSARFMAHYLPTIGFGDWVDRCGEIVHFTGYERPLDTLKLTDPRDVKVGHLLGTADMIAQMADRCYLEKCRDRLYAEFVLGGVALPMDGNGGSAPQVKYASGLDLLRQTPDFVVDVRAKRLDGQFDRAYRYLEVLFGGSNPYIEAIERNLDYLRQILRSENWRLLRRNPPVFAAEPDTMTTTRTLMLGYIKKAWSAH